MWENPKRVEGAIKRLTREIDEIDRYFYHQNVKEDRSLYAGMLERKRDDVVRSVVLQMHTTIEDLLNSHIMYRVTGSIRNHPSQRNRSARAMYKVLHGGGSIGFEMKLNLALALRIINGKTKDRLAFLNTLRNKCSHHWILKVPVRRGRRPAQKKPPLLYYEGRDLHQVATLKECMDEYIVIYLKLYSKLPD